MRSDEEEGAVCGSSQSSWEVETRLQAKVRANAKATADWLIRGEGWLTPGPVLLSNQPRFPLIHSLDLNQPSQA